MGDVAERYGCGRAMWEYSASTEKRFGTPEALMLLPYWTNNCVGSMEGLLMESSPTTPYHYLDQSELSVAPSDPQVGLAYGPVDVALGVGHLQMLGVKYFVAFSPARPRPGPKRPRPAARRQDARLARPGRAVADLSSIRTAPSSRPSATTPNVVADIASQAQWLEREPDVVAQRRYLQHGLRRDERAGVVARALSVTTKMAKSAPLPSVDRDATCKRRTAVDLLPRLVVSACRCS